MTLEELKNQLTEIGACEINIVSMYGVHRVHLKWPNGVAVSTLDVDLEVAVTDAIVLGARRGAVS